MAKTKKIDLTGFSVMGEDGKPLFNHDNPHVVSEQFAAELIAGHRAQEHDPANPIVHEPPAEPEPASPARVQKRDPKAENRDPK